MDEQCVTDEAFRTDANARARPGSRRRKTGNAMGERVGGGHPITSTVSLRMRASHARRMVQRGQSFHNTAVRGCGTGAGAQVGGETECEESSGHNTSSSPSWFEGGAADQTLCPASGRRDNGQCARHTRLARSHHARDAGLSDTGDGKPDTVASHQVAG
jgi:hypothetical protein